MDYKNEKYKDEIYKVTMYYDEYEYENGDGFYPSVYIDNACNKEIDLFFVYKSNYWKQIDYTPLLNSNADADNEKYFLFDNDNNHMCKIIKGLDETNGSLLLSLLNNQANTDFLFIYNSIGYQIYRE